MMNMELFMKMVYGVREYDEYFKRKKKPTRLVGFSPVKKCMALVRYLAYGTPPDTQDVYLCMSNCVC
jgi:hypothetical protein